MAIDNNLLETEAFIKRLNGEWKAHYEALKLSGDELRRFIDSAKIPSNYPKGLQSMLAANQKLAVSQKKINTTLTEHDKFRKKQIETEVRWQRHLKKQEAAEKKLADTQARAAKKYLADLEKKRKKAAQADLDWEKQMLKKFNRTKKGIEMSEQEREELRLKRREAREVAKMSSTLSTEYEKQAVKLTILKRRYKDIVLAEKEQTVEGRKLFNELNRIDKALNKASVSAKSFNSNINNSPKAMASAKNAARSLASVAGYAGGLFLVARGARDAFNRVREFDKSMQNLSGIMRKDRSDLKDLEKVIIDVAGSSIKTSREVASLAESLATLGESKENIKVLLEPVNNLGIGLEASSAEAGEFLIQMMNSFGASTSEAKKYANTIASLRMSTTLDFQKMRDSFQYVASISKILNKDLAYTGSLIGILTKNGIKAESAGRLIATAQRKLAVSGKTLKDGLDDINEAKRTGLKETELLAYATRVFGGDAAKLGIVLAENSDKLEVNSEKIRNNAGALDELVEKQLASLDAALASLDSTWEKFIFSLENGEGVLSKAFKGVLSFVDKAIKGFIILNQTRDEFLNGKTGDAEKDTYKAVSEQYEKMGDSAKELAIIEADKSRDKIDSIKSEMALLQKKDKEAKESGDAISFLNTERIDYLAQELGYHKGVLRASEDILLIEKEINKEKNKNTKDYSKNVVRGKKKIVSATLEEKDATVALNLEIKKYIAYLNELKDSSLGDPKDIKELEDRIKGLEDALSSSLTKVDISKELNDLAEIAKVKRDMHLDEIRRGGEIERKNEEAERTIEGYINNLKDGIFESLGLEALGAFATIEENGQTMFQNLWESADSTGEKITVVMQAVSAAINDVAQLSQKAFQQQLKEIDEKERISLKYAGDSAHAKDVLEEQFAEKRKKIQEKQAKAQKDLATFNTITNTATAVVNTLATVPAPAGIVLSTVIGALGLAQLAIIKNSEIPKFKDGGTHVKGGNLIMGDGGVNEYAVTPSGDVIKSADTDTLYNLPKGTEIYKNENDFMSYLNKQLATHGITPLKNHVLPKIDAPTNKATSERAIVEAVVRSMMNVQDAIENKETSILNLDKKGIAGYTRKSGGISRKENARSTGRGYEV